MSCSSFVLPNHFWTFKQLLQFVLQRQVVQPSSSSTHPQCELFVLPLTSRWWPKALANSKNVFVLSLRSPQIKTYKPTQSFMIWFVQWGSNQSRIQHVILQCTGLFSPRWYFLKDQNLKQSFVLILAGPLPDTNVAQGQFLPCLCNTGFKRFYKEALIICYFCKEWRSCTLTKGARITLMPAHLFWQTSKDSDCIWSIFPHTEPLFFLLLCSYSSFYNTVCVCV